MLTLIDFGRYHNLSKEELQKDKELFLKKKRELANFTLDHNRDLSKYEGLEESQLDEIIKEKFSRIKYSIDVQCALGNFLYAIGLNENLLNDDEKKQILNMKLTYDNCKKFALNHYDKYIEKAKDECPSEIYICFEEKIFITYCITYRKAEINKNNFLYFIRDYYILDKYKECYGDYRNNSIFNKIRDKMIDLYPVLKDEFGRKNKTFDKFMSFFEVDNDYNYEFIKELLNNYEKKNKNKFIKLKKKED